MSIHLPRVHHAGLDVIRARFFIVSLLRLYIHADVCQNNIALAHLEVFPTHSITNPKNKIKVFKTHHHA
jgi:hypothetical protein